MGDVGTPEQKCTGFHELCCEVHAYSQKHRLRWTLWEQVHCLDRRRGTSALPGFLSLRAGQVVAIHKLEVPSARAGCRGLRWMILSRAKTLFRLISNSEAQERFPRVTWTGVSHHWRHDILRRAHETASEGLRLPGEQPRFNRRALLTSPRGIGAVTLCLSAVRVSAWEWLWIGVSVSVGKCADPGTCVCECVSYVECVCKCCVYVI